MQPFLIPSSVTEATAIQRSLQARVVLEGPVSQHRYVAALDASHPTRFSKVKGASAAAAVLWDMQAQKVLEVATATVDEAALFPYVPGFLSFRESPVYLAALGNLKHPYQMLLVDGQGVAHPRGFGIACHLGVHLGVPSIGVAKTLLYGRLERDLPEAAGSAVRLMAGGRQVGWAYRSRARIQPLYVSPGHLAGMEEALEFVRGIRTEVRLPEPLRRAHIEAGESRRGSADGGSGV
ncbi:MAG: endonuclease V [Meiothermus sp.]|nr:endonuclease V [Meiothermus sp.]